MIQINNNVETLAMAKEDIGLVREMKTLGAAPSPKGKTFH